MPVSDEALARSIDGADARLLLLDDLDNVYVVRQRINAGERIVINGSVAEPAPRDIPLGHKVARRTIAAGEKIVKYGAPIGTATEDIVRGAHVHVTNVRSDYTPTYHLLDAEGDGQ